MNIQARLKQAEERAMLLQKKADTIHLIMVKPVPGKERLYTILGEDGIYNEKKLAEFQQKHSVVTTIILNIPRFEIVSCPVLSLCCCIFRPVLS